LPAETTEQEPAAFSVLLVNDSNVNITSSLLYEPVCDYTWKGPVAPEVGIDADEIEETFEDGS
jgi:hypothetical protein